MNNLNTGKLKNMKSDLLANPILTFMGSLDANTLGGFKIQVYL